MTSAVAARAPTSAGSTSKSRDSRRLPIASERMAPRTIPITTRVAPHRDSQPRARLPLPIATTQYAGPRWDSVAIKSRDMDGSIGPADFRPSAGCESAYLAFDPDNPRYQYGGCCLGQITERDEATGLSRNVQILPGLPASVEPKDMPYRFNWNARRSSFRPTTRT